MDSKVLDKLEDVLHKYEEIERSLSSSEVISDHKKLSDLSKIHKSLEGIVQKYIEYKKNLKELTDLKTEEYEDKELFALAQDEIHLLEKRLEEGENSLKVMLLPKDPNDEKNVVVEIRAGAGGDEAGIFVGDLYRMYQRYSESVGWKIEPINFSDAISGGFKEVIFLVKGDGAYSRLKYESGVHRVQRVPKTESAGRIHTSTVTVAVLPEMDDVMVNIEMKDLDIDTYRSSGAGGQHVNTTDSAIRITHKPSGLIVTCQDERSQLKNREKAMKILSIKLQDYEAEKQRNEVDSARKTQIGTGDRSEKVRTYNYPQSRITDHRINLTVHNLEMVMEGSLQDILDSLMAFDQAEKLKQDIVG